MFLSNFQDVITSNDKSQFITSPQPQSTSAHQGGLSPLRKHSQLELNTPSSSEGSALSQQSKDCISNIYSNKREYGITGEVKLSVIFKDGVLKVYMIKARDLAATKKKGYSNPYVRVNLLPGKSTKYKQTTHVITKTVNPEYNVIMKVCTFHILRLKCKKRKRRL